MAQGEPTKDAPFDDRRAEPTKSRSDEVTYDARDRLDDMYSRQIATLERSEERLRDVTENLEAQLSALDQRTAEISSRIWWMLVLIVFSALFLYFKKR